MGHLPHDISVLWHIMTTTCHRVRVGVSHRHTEHYLAPTGGQQRFRCLFAAPPEKARFAAHFSTLSLLGRTIFLPFMRLLLTPMYINGT